MRKIYIVFAIVALVFAGCGSGTNAKKATTDDGTSTNTTVNGELDSSNDNDNSCLMTNDCPDDEISGDDTGDDSGDGDDSDNGDGGGNGGKKDPTKPSISVSIPSKLLIPLTNPVYKLLKVKNYSAATDIEFSFSEDDIVEFDLGSDNQLQVIPLKVGTTNWTINAFDKITRTKVATKTGTIIVSERTVDERDNSVSIRAITELTGAAGAPYTATIRAKNEDQPNAQFIWSIEGVLPDGLSADTNINGMDLTIQGTPTTGGDTKFEVKACDKDKATANIAMCATNEFTIKISDTVDLGVSKETQGIPTPVNRSEIDKDHPVEIDSETTRLRLEAKGASPNDNDYSWSVVRSSAFTVSATGKINYLTLIDDTKKGSGERVTISITYQGKTEEFLLYVKYLASGCNLAELTATIKTIRLLDNSTISSEETIAVNPVEQFEFNVSVKRGLVEAVSNTAYRNSDVTWEIIPVGEGFTCSGTQCDVSPWKFYLSVSDDDPLSAGGLVMANSQPTEATAKVRVTVKDAQCQSRIALTETTIGFKLPQ